MKIGTVRLDIEGYRTDPTSRRWELPPWGHPISQGVFPLFATANGRLFPVATAFVIGRNIPYMMTAEHNIREVFKHEPRLAHLQTAAELPALVDLKHAGLTVLHHRRTPDGKIEFRLWPLESVDGAPPTDIVFGTPRLQQRIPVLTLPISLDVPAIEERVLSVGYAGFRCPDDGIPLDAVKSGAFNWEQDYSHRLMVVEGTVKRIFTQSFANSYLGSACFMFDEEIEHAQSGGPVLSLAGIVRGINSAGATSFFPHPASLASLLYPVAFAKLRATLRLGIVTFGLRSNLMKLIARAAILTDGSEARLGIFEDDATGNMVAAPKFDPAAGAFTHDDFRAYQDGRPASTTSNPKFRFRNQ